MDRLQDGFSSLRADIGATIDSLQSVSRGLNGINGGVGNLSDAIDTLRVRIGAEEARLAALEKVSRRTDAFLSDTVQTDARVASMLAENQERFFSQCTWLRPVAAEEKSWWEQRVDDWTSFWGDVGDTLKTALDGVISFVREHAMEFAVGAAAVVVGAGLIALTGGTTAAFLPALFGGLKAAAVSAAIGGTVSAAAAAFTGGDVLSSFGDGLASGFMWGGVFFAASGLVSWIRSGIAGKTMTSQKQVRVNAKDGKLFADEQYAKYKAKNPTAQREITIEAKSGVRVRVDSISVDDGVVTIREFKGSPTAPLTPNQAVGYPEIFESGGVVKGAGKGIFTGGFEIPPGTPVEIIRPDVPNSILRQVRSISNLSGAAGGVTGAATAAASP